MKFLSEDVKVGFSFTLGCFISSVTEDICRYFVTTLFSTHHGAFLLPYFGSRILLWAIQRKINNLLTRRFGSQCDDVSLGLSASNCKYLNGNRLSRADVFAFKPCNVEIALTRLKQAHL